MKLRNPLKATLIALFAAACSCWPTSRRMRPLRPDPRARGSRDYRRTPDADVSHAGVARRTTVRVATTTTAVAATSAAAASTAAATSTAAQPTQAVAQQQAANRRSSRRRSRNNRQRWPSSKRRPPGRRRSAPSYRRCPPDAPGWPRAASSTTVARHRLLPRGIPGQQPRLRHRGAAVIRREAHRMNKGSIRAALGVAVLTALASLPQDAHARGPRHQSAGRGGRSWRGRARRGCAWRRCPRPRHQSAGRGGQSRRGRAGGGCARRRCPRPRHQPAGRDGQPGRRWAWRGRARRRRGGSWAQPAWRRRKRGRRGPAFGQAVAAAALAGRVPVSSARRRAEARRVLRPRCIRASQA